MVNNIIGNICSNPTFEVNPNFVVVLIIVLTISTAKTTTLYETDMSTALTVIKDIRSVRALNTKELTVEQKEMPQCQRIEKTVQIKQYSRESATQSSRTETETKSRGQKAV